MECPICNNKHLIIDEIGLYCTECGFNLHNNEENNHHPKPKEDEANPYKFTI